MHANLLPLCTPAEPAAAAASSAARGVDRLRLIRSKRVAVCDCGEATDDPACLRVGTDKGAVGDMGGDQRRRADQEISDPGWASLLRVYSSVEEGMWKRTLGVRRRRHCCWGARWGARPARGWTVPVAWPSPAPEGSSRVWASCSQVLLETRHCGKMMSAHKHQKRKNAFDLNKRLTFPCIFASWMLSTRTGAALRMSELVACDSAAGDQYVWNRENQHVPWASLSTPQPVSEDSAAATSRRACTSVTATAEAEISEFWGESRCCNVIVSAQMLP